jgi:hypothetical protein
MCGRQLFVERSTRSAFVRGVETGKFIVRSGDREVYDLRRGITVVRLVYAFLVDI